MPAPYPRKTIDCTPTWAAVLPILTDALARHKPSTDAHQHALRELRRMAQAADAHNAAVKGA